MVHFDRRSFLMQSGALALGCAVNPVQCLFAQNGRTTKTKTLVIIFLRGAADGLAIVPPLTDSHFGRHLRPNISTPYNQLLKLNGSFGLHPALKKLHPFWNDKRLAIVHQVGSPHPTRSHFDAQDYMESGAPGIKSIETGFLARALSLQPESNTIAQGIALAPHLPRALTGHPSAFAIGSLNDFTRLTKRGKNRMRLHHSFEGMYTQALDQALKGAGEDTFNAIGTFSKLPPNRLAYPKNKLAKNLADIARLIKGNIGLNIAMTNMNGWDTHKGQGAQKGRLANQLGQLGDSMATFAKDLGSDMENVCVVTLTEFGRTVKQNGTGGTDHGHGSIMMLLGNQVNGGQLHGNWKSLKPENLFEGRDLPVTNDFRDIWHHTLTQHLKFETKGLFPDFTPSKAPLNIF